MNRLWQIYAWGTIVLAGIVMATIGFWLFYPVKVIDYKNAPFPVERTTIQAGDQIHYPVEYCKYKDILFTTTRSFVDGIVFSTPSFTGQWELGCHTKVITLQIPKVLPPGNYHIQIIHTIKLNPLREQTITLETESFEVTNNIK